MWRPHRRFGQRNPHHDGRLLPQWRADRPQDQSRGGHRGGQEAGPEGREGADLAALPRQVLVEDGDGQRPGLLRQRPARGLQGSDRRTDIDAGRSAAFPHVHERHHSQAEGLPAQHWRLPRLRRGNVKVLPGHPSRGHVLVLCRYRLDHRPFVHRVRTPRTRRDQRDVRGSADLPRPWPSVEDCRTSRREHLPHRAHHHPHAAQARPG